MKRKDDKLVLMNAVVEPALREAVYQLATSLGVTKAKLAGELLLLGLMMRTGRSVDELLEGVENGLARIS